MKWPKKQSENFPWVKNLQIIRRRWDARRVVKGNKSTPSEYSVKWEGLWFRLEMYFSTLKSCTEALACTLSLNASERGELSEATDSWLTGKQRHLHVLIGWMLVAHVILSFIYCIRAGFQTAARMWGTPVLILVHILRPHLWTSVSFTNTQASISLGAITDEARSIVLLNRRY